MYLSEHFSQKLVHQILKYLLKYKSSSSYILKIHIFRSEMKKNYCN